MKYWSYLEISAKWWPFNPGHPKLLAFAMSADLFAEFGVGSTSAQSSNQSHQQKSRSQANLLIPDLETTDASLSANPWGDLNASTIQTTQQKSYPGNSPTFQPNYLGNSGHRPQQYDNNVLFDASLEAASNNDSDEWGEFESAEAPSQIQPTNTTRETNPRGGNADLSTTGNAFSGSLNLIDSSIEDSAPPARRAPTVTPAGNAQSQRTQSKSMFHTPARPLAEQDESFENWGEFIDGPNTIQSKSTPHTPAKLSGKPDEPSEDWGDFVDGPPIKPTPKEIPTEPERATSKVPSKNMDQHTSSPQVRPTNIPPPSVLLQMFPQLFERLRREATTARKDPQQNGILEHTALQILYTLKTAARVIAGRTLRWKRDSILSQSMRIGPARSGKQGGMKLNTVNKNENIKEQQEALDILGIWRDRMALFNSVLQASGKRPIPVIAENTRVMTATADQGALKAPHPCALCGLKRDERLPKVDERVEDSFGEWWTDHWGHTDCKQFWETNMRLLDQR